MNITGTGFWPIAERSMVQIVRRPIYWIAMLGLPLFMFLFITSMFEQGLPTRIPAAIVDKDGTSLSREITQTLGGMQMVDLTETADSYTRARHLMQEGKIYGFFLIPENFQSDLLAGRAPTITFYTNMVYYVPGSLLFKTFKTTALYTKAGVISSVASQPGSPCRWPAPPDRTPRPQPRCCSPSTSPPGPSGTHSSTTASTYPTRSFPPCSS